MSRNGLIIEGMARRAAIQFRCASKQLTIETFHLSRGVSLANLESDMTPPAFIAFTGVDRLDLVDGLQALSRRYPIEWGLLIDDAQAHKSLFPDAECRAALLRSGGLRWAAHVCGAAARAVVEEGDADIDLAGFQRVQINHGFSGSTPAQVENAWRFGRRRALRPVLQCADPFPADPRVDWLYDVSFGKGLKPRTWPTLDDAIFCGYSGGIGPETVAEVLAVISAPPGAVYWIDMESAVRSDDRLDLAKCEAVCRAVYGA